MTRKHGSASINGGGPLKLGEVEQYLKTLGERVRDARACHGMTRGTLARESGVSERYLALLESGRGNFSILLLRKVARALDVPLSELVNEEPRLAAEYSLLLEKLRHLSSAKLAAAAALLFERFGDGAGRHTRIALIGVRGAGKTALGRMLAQRLKVPFIELTKEIESAVGTSVSEIFEFWGQAAYRRYERRALERVLKTHSRVVIAAGGGLVSQPSTFGRLLDCCYTIWLQASPKELMSRMAKQGDYRVRAGLGETEALADLRRILAQRRALYGKADVALDTTGKTMETSLEELIALVMKAGPTFAGLAVPGEDAAN